MAKHDALVEARDQLGLNRESCADHRAPGLSGRSRTSMKRRYRHFNSR